MGTEGIVTSNIIGTGGRLEDGYKQRDRRGYVKHPENDHVHGSGYETDGRRNNHASNPVCKNEKRGEADETRISGFSGVCKIE